MKPYLLAGIVAVVVSGVLWGVLPSKNVVTTQTVYDKSGKPVQQFGALTGPDIPSPYLRWGGVSEERGSMVMNTGTTTVCSIQSPAATSTLHWASARFDTSSSTATQLYIAKSANMTSTTTSLGQTTAKQLAITTAAANTVGAVIGTTASSTAAGVVDGYIFSPNTYLLVAMAGGIGTFSPTGECKVSWLVN